MKSEQQLKRTAHTLLKRAGVLGAPVDVYAVAKHLNASIRSEKASADLSGALYRLPTHAIIGVNSAHSPVRRRFTVAHEIGHLLLHDRAVFIDRAYPALQMDSNVPRFRRDTISSQAVDNNEIEANRFAACLLMPETFLRRDLAAHRLPIAEDSVRKLARQYQVSSQAMTFRLINLGIPIEQI